MTQFREGQEVEVVTFAQPTHGRFEDHWRKAKIVALPSEVHLREDKEYYQVQFHDGSRGVFSEAHIRAGEEEPFWLDYAAKHGPGHAID